MAVTFDSSLAPFAPSLRSGSTVRLGVTTTMRLMILIALSGCVALPSAAQRPRLEVTYLANMGVLLEGGGKRVVIDGFHRAELDGYAAVPPATLAALEQSRELYASLDLALTTHRHPDHFNAESVVSRLRSDSAVVYIAARETVDSLHARTTLRRDAPQAALRVLGVVPPARGQLHLPTSGVDVTVLDLPHNPTRSARVANIGFLVTMSGLRILHVGDADPAAATFDVHGLSRRQVDIAIVPYWYLTGGDGSIARAIGADRWIATHVSPSEADVVRREVLERMPAALVLTTPGERHAIP